LGGIYYPKATGRVWAADSLGAANTIVNQVKESADGYKYLIPAIMSPTSHMSNKTMASIGVALLREAYYNKEVKRDPLYKDIIGAFSKNETRAKLPLVKKKLGSRPSINKMLEVLDELVIGDDLTFEERKAAIFRIVGESGVGKPKYPTVGTFSELAKVLAERKTQGLDLHQVITVIRTKGDLKAVKTPETDEFYHESYRYHIESDAEVELLVLDEAYNLTDIIPEFTTMDGKTYSTKETLETKKEDWTDERAKKNLGRTHGMASYSAPISTKTKFQKPLSEDEQFANEYIDGIEEDGYLDDFSPEEIYNDLIGAGYDVDLNTVKELYESKKQEGEVRTEPTKEAQPTPEKQKEDTTVAKKEPKDGKRDEGAKKQPKKSKVKFDNSAIFKGTSVKRKHRTNPQYSDEALYRDSVVMAQASKEAERIADTHDIDDIRDEIDNPNSEMHVVLKQMLIAEVGARLLSSGDIKRSQEWWDKYAPVLTDASYTMLAQQYVMKDPRVETIMFTQKKQAEIDKELSYKQSNGKTTGENIKDGFNKLKDLASKVGAKVSESDSVDSIIDKIVKKYSKSSGSRKTSRQASERKKLFNKFKDFQEKASDVLKTGNVPKFQKLNVPLTEDMIKLALGVARTYIKEGDTDLETLISNISQDFDDNLDIELDEKHKSVLSERIKDMYIADAMTQAFPKKSKKKPTEKTPEQFLKEEIRRLINENYEDVDTAKRKDQISQLLSDRLALELGLSESDAKSLEKAVFKEFDKQFRDRAKSIVENVEENVGVPAKKVGRKSDVDKIVEAVNSNSFDESATGANVLREIVANKVGIGDMSVEVARAITTLVTQVNYTPKDSELQKQHIRDLDFLINSQKTKPKAEKVMEWVLDLSYAGMLSGISTVSRAIKGGMITSFLESLAVGLANPIAASRGMSLAASAIGRYGFTEAKRVFWSGWSDADFYNKQSVGSGKLDTLINTSYKTLKQQYKSGVDSKTKTAIKAVAKFYLGVPVRIFRSVMAFDAFTKVGLREYRAYIEAYNAELQDSGQISRFHADFLNNVNKRLARDESSMAKAEKETDQEINQMKERGIPVPNWFKKKRLQENIEKIRDQRTADITQRTHDFANTAMLMNDPTGVVGKLYGLVKDVTETRDKDKSPMKIVKMLTRLVVFPFARVGSNFVNMNIKYNPAVGLPRLAAYEIMNKFEKDPSKKRKPHELIENISRLAIGSGVMAMLYASLFDVDDDDELILNEDSWIKVYGNGVGSYYKNKLLSKNFDRYDGLFFEIDLPFLDEPIPFSYKDNPLGMVLAPFGMLSDEIRIDMARSKQDEEKGVDPIGRYELASKIIPASFVFSMSQSYSQSVQSIAKITGVGASDKTIGERFLNESIAMPSKTAKSIVMPNFYMQMNKYTKALTDSPQKYTDRDTFDGILQKNLMKDVPFLDMLIENEETDIFGYPIVRDFDVPLLPDVAILAIKDNISYREDLPEWKILWSDESIYTTPYVTMPTNNYVDGYGKLEGDDILNYKTDWKKEFKDNFNKLYDREKSKGKKVLPGKVNDILEEARRKATDRTKKNWKKKKKSNIF
jgi:hypothetical protein